jgi:hypothetical protein
VSRLDDELAALANLSPAQLKEKWTGMEGTLPPAVPTALLRALVGQRLQERRHGALSALVARELMRVTSRGAEAPPPPPKIQLTPGTRLVREWNGQGVTVEVLEQGFAFADRTWRSLSEIARHVTGAHWSGPRFFGIVRIG